MDDSPTSSSCFIDTGVFFAAFNKDDTYHTDASLLLISSIMGWFGRVYTSTYIVDEVMTLTKARIGGSLAIRVAERIQSSRKITVLKVEEREEVLTASFGKFKKYSDMRGLSFTDCTTLALQDNHKIECLLTFEENFRLLVPMLLGEGYQKILDTEHRRLLTGVAQELGITF